MHMITVVCVNLSGLKCHSLTVSILTIMFDQTTG